MEKKLTDEEIVKALECCAVEPCEDCGNCPRFTKEKLCHKANAKQSLDIIQRQKAEIEQLKGFIDFKTANVMCDKCKEQTVKDTAKEIFEWLEKHCFFNGFEIVETYFRERYGVEVE